MAAQSQPESTTSFTCSICLGVIRILSAAPGSKATDEPITALNQSDDPVSIFELSSPCKHKFCATCLRAYVRSKLMDGQLEIPCCHSMIHPWEDEPRPCGKLLSEDDLFKLVHMDVCDDSKKKNEWLCNTDVDYERSSTCDSKEQCNEEKIKGNELWIKYHKLKFDKLHGKDVVRRCPIW